MPCVYAPAPPPSPSYTSQFSERPSRLYIHPAISQAPSVQCVFLFGQSCWPPASVYCVVRKNSPLGAVDQGSGEASGNRLRLFHSHPWAEKPTMTNQILSMQSPGSYCLRLLSIPEDSLSLLFPRLPSLSHSIFYLCPSIIHFFPSLPPSIIHPSLNPPTQASLPLTIA